MPLPFPNKTIHQLFEEQVEKAPEKIALIFEEQKLTYRELNERANQLAHYLKKHHDIEPDTLIGMSLERGVECIISLLAILKTGGAYVPLDPDYPKERLQFMLQDTNIDIILTRENLVQHLPVTEKNIVFVESGLYQDFPASNPHSIVQPQHLAYVLYTSGTTGRPKGVMVEHRNVVKLVTDQSYVEISSQDVVTQLIHINFDLAAFDIWGALVNGATLAILPGKTLLSSQSLKAVMQQSNVTVCQLTSAHFDQLVVQDASLFSGLRYLIIGGDVINCSTVDKVLAKKEHRPKAILNEYGPTEATITATYYRIPEDFKAGQRSMPIGLPLSYTQTYILDDHLQPVPTGTVGELYIGGAGVARGYLNRPEATREKFIVNPFTTADGQEHGRNLRLYRSGDLVRSLPDGNIEFLGRRDQQVKIRGFRIECGEIEHALLSHDQIAQAVVKVVEYCGEKQLVAYYVLKKNLSSLSPSALASQSEALTKGGNQSELSIEVLQKYLQTRLPKYMIPQHFMLLDALPLTPNGKLDARALPAPQTSLSALISTPFVAPRSQLEAQLAALWSEVLGQKQIGIHDDFFELGGTSLLAMKLVSTINKNLNIEMSVPDLLYLKNIEVMAKKIALFDSKDPRKEQKQSEINKNEVTESEKLILRDYFLSDFKLTYNENFVVELNQPVSFEKFSFAIHTLLSEYEILHANYFCTEGVFSRKINKKSPIECDHYDFSHCVDPDTEFLNCIHVLVKKEFNIGQDKLIRFYLFQLNENRYRIFVVFFHALLDGTSITILCRKLFHLMNLTDMDTVVKLRDSKQDELPQDDNPDDFYLLGSQIKEHYRKGIASAVKLRHDNPRDDKLTYWREFFNQFEYCPVSPGTGHSKSRLGKQESFAIENAVKENLLELSKKLHISLFDVLLGCFMLLLNKFTQQSHIAVRTSINERIYASQYAETLGCFINNLFLGVKIDADATLLDLLTDSKKNKDQAINNGLSYDSLIEHFREKVIDLSHVHFNLAQDDLDDLDFYPSQVHTHSGHIKNNLYFELDIKKDKILARVEYNVEEFDKNFIASLIQCYTNILEKVELFLNQPLKNINVLPDAQYHKVVHSFNAGKIYPSTKTIHQVFEEQVEKNPKQVAVSYNGTLLTYEELNAKANQLAHYLRQNDAVVPGSLITLCLEKSEQILIAILAVLKVGAAYVPIDPRSPDDRMRYMLQDTNSRVIITHSVHRQNIAIFTQHSKTDVIAIDEPSFAENLNKQPIKNLDVTISNDELAYVIYTSGTTGNPKGVMQTHYNVIRLFATTEDLYNFNGNDIWVLFHSYIFDFSVWEMWGALFYGGKLIIPTEEQTRDPNMLYMLCYQEQVTVLNQTSHALYQFIDVAIHKEKLALKYVLFGAEAVNTKRLKPWAQYYGFEQPKLIHVYGITETTVLSTCKEIAFKHLEGNSCPVGKAFSDVKVYILDAYLGLVPLGAAGELYVGGSGLAKGYWNRPQLTQERFVGNPFQTVEEQKKQYNAKLYKTGDIVRWLPDGELEYIRRNDLQIKIRGYRVELDDVAHNILEHPLISEAVVLAAEDPEKGKYLTAYYVEKENEAYHSTTVPCINTAQLRQFLESKLPRYMLPAIYIKLDFLPLTIQGKVDRKKLLSLTNKDFEHSAHYVPPRTPDEIALVEIWAKVLKLEKNVVGVKDDFFALGGHSLLVTNLISQIQAKFNVDLHVRDLFIKPTVHGLLSLIYKRIAPTSSQHHKTRSEIDFDAEAILPQDIYPEETEYRPTENPQNIFLTGASGFLGGYLLEELLKKTKANIYCLVRAGSSAEARYKLLSSLKEKYIAVETYKNRIIALPGDLAQPHFALSAETFELLTKKIDVIYHNGAAVNFLYPYEFLKAANVDSVKEVLRLAKAKRLKPIHYISTLGVFTSLHLRRSIAVINEDQPVDFAEELFMGYPETKWVAEKLLCEAKKRQFPICIYRFLEVAGHSKTGASNTKSLDIAFLKGCIEMRAMEDLPIKKYYAPVDYLAQAIVYLSQQTSSISQNFHLHNPNPISQEELVKILNDLGYPVTFSPYDIWVKKIIQNPQNPLYVYQPLFTEKWTAENITVIEMFTEQRRPHYGFQNTLSGLAKSGLICPKIDREYIRRCLDYLIQAGYMPESKIEIRENKLG